MSNKMLNKIKQIYEEREEQVSFDLWDKLKNRLDENLSDEVSENETPRPSFGWFKYAAIFLIFATLGGILLMNSNEETEQNQIVKTENNQIEKNENSSQQIIETQPTENIDVVSNETQIANVESQKNSSIQTTSNKFNPNSNQQNNSLKNQVEVFEKSQNILAQKPEVKEEVQKNIPQIIEQKTFEIQQEQKAIAKNRKAYIKASDLLFGRELQKTSIEKTENPKTNFGVISISKVKFRSPSTVDILDITVYSEEPTNP